MSTLREIAENHAKKAIAMQAQSANMNEPCPARLLQAQAPEPEPASYLAPHTLAAISEKHFGHAMSY